MNDKPGSPPCGIYARKLCDPADEMQITHLRQIAMVINRFSGYEKNMDVIELEIAQGEDREESMRRAALYVKLLQADSMVVIIKDSAEDAALLEADGVLLSNTADIEKARKILGEDGIIGMSDLKTQSKCREIMERGGIDYVCITPRDNGSLVRWWREQGTKILCVADCGADESDCGVYARAGAHFAETSNYLFTHEKGVIQATANILQALNEGATKLH